MRVRQPNLVAVDGADGDRVIRRARAAARTARTPAVSWWDASGLFEQLVVAGTGAGVPSARTLLLLYAADLAFRLRWEIEPALAEGRTVIAAPYVATAVAFGRAVGLPAGWLQSLFAFAPRAGREHRVAGRGRSSRATGFIEFAAARVADDRTGLTRARIAARTRHHLST